MKVAIAPPYRRYVLLFCWILIGIFALMPKSVLATTHSQPPDLRACPPDIAFGETIQCSIGIAGVGNSYKFTAQANEAVLVRMGFREESPEPYVRVFDPGGNKLCEAFTTNGNFAKQSAEIEACPLPSTGTYTIIASEYEGDETGGYTLSLQRLTAPEPTISFGQTISDSVFTSADTAAHNFFATTATVVLVRMGFSEGAPEPNVRVFDPGGNKLCEAFTLNGNFAKQSAEIEACSLPSTGIYTIIASEYEGDETGAYTVSLQRLTNTQPTIFFGETISNSVFSTADSSAYSFVAQANKVAYLNFGYAKVAPEPYIRVFDQRGNKLCEAFAQNGNFTNHSAEIETCRLPTTGTYTIIASEYEGDEIGEGYHLTLACLSADCQEADDNDTCSQAAPIEPDGQAQAHTFVQPGEVDWARFAAVADTTYRVEVIIPDDSPADVDLALHIACDAAPANLWEETFAPGVQFDFTATSNGPVFLQLRNQDETVGGNHVAYQLSVRPLPPDPNRGALIIVAGRLRTNDALQRNIHNVTDRVYTIFQEQGYTNDNIYYLAADSTLIGYDAAATEENLQKAITEWAVAQVAENQSLTLYLIDHGDPAKFYLDGSENDIVTPVELNEWLTAFENAVPIARLNIIIEACYIGSFITASGSQADSISKAGRVVITSSDSIWSAYASRQGAHFSDHFLTALQQGQDLSTSFIAAQRRVNRLFGRQNPWLDANGDGKPNQPADFAIARERGFAYAGTLPGADNLWPPFIAAVTPPTVAEHHGRLSIEVRDDKAVEHVWAVIYPPSYVPPVSNQALITETLPVVDLIDQGNGRYEIDYPAFDEDGRYRIVFYAGDSAGNLAQPVEATTGSAHRLFLPLVMR